MGKNKKRVTRVIDLGELRDNLSGQKLSIWVNQPVGFLIKAIQVFKAFCDTSLERLNKKKSVQNWLINFFYKTWNSDPDERFNLSRDRVVELFNSGDDELVFFCIVKSMFFIELFKREPNGILKSKAVKYGNK